jgi:hypothetical protein
MTTAKWTISTEEQQDLRYRAARFKEKGCLPVWGGDALRGRKKCPLAPSRAGTSFGNTSRLLLLLLGRYYPTPRKKIGLLENGT